LQAPQFMNPYAFMNAPIPTHNPQFNAIAHQTAYNNYDYTGAAHSSSYPAFYNGNLYPQYPTTGDMVAPSMAQFTAFCQFQQNQQQQLPPMLPTPQLPAFSQITNTAIASNPAAATLNGSASLYYNGIG